MRRFLLLMLALAGQASLRAERPQLAEVHRLFSFGCPNSAGHAGTAFQLVNHRGYLTSLHTVNGCTSVKAFSVSGKGGYASLKPCRVAVESDVAIMDVQCDGNYDLAFDPPLLEDETLYVIGYPIQAGQFRRPVFLFRHENRAVTTLASLGLDGNIFTLEKGIGVARTTPVIVIGSGIAPGDSGAPLVTRRNQVVGLVGGGRRESGNGALVGITWATALGPELGRTLVNPNTAGAKFNDDLRRIARNALDQVFSQEAFKRSVNDVEFAELTLDSTGSQPVRHYWVMTAEATRQSYDECVRARQCRAGPRFDLAAAQQPVLIDRIEDARSFCSWLGAKPISLAVWSAAAAYPQYGQALPYVGCSVNLKDLPACRDRQRPLDVRSTQPNQAGFYDLFGNVWDWADTPDGRGAVAGGAFNTPSAEVRCTSPGQCGKPIRERARAGTIGVRCMIPFDRDSTAASTQ